MKVKMVKFFQSVKLSSGEQSYLSNSKHRIRLEGSYIKIEDIEGKQMVFVPTNNVPFFTVDEEDYPLPSKSETPAKKKP